MTHTQPLSTRCALAAARLVAGCAVLALAALPVRAQTFPSKPIEIINSFSPGGTSDLNLRALETASERVFGQRTIQTFKPGGGGISGTTEVAHAKPDGYKLLVVTSGELTAGPNLAKTTYTLDSFTFLGRLSSTPYGFVVLNDSPWKDFNSFRNATIAEPGKFTMGTAPRGGVFLAAQHVIQQSKIKVTVVPFGGSGPYVTAVLGGHVNAALAPLPSIEAHLKAGTLRLLAITGSSRVPDHADVPTLKELGIDAPIVLWVGLVAPRDVPPDRVKFLRDGIARISKDPTYIGTADKLGIDHSYTSAGEFEAQVRQEDKDFKVLVQRLGLAPKDDR